ncbi:MAG: LLM class flavin-dependent oxidoreductase [Alphaproteobacteria bacterium]|nr:LLM class flavin-dependent oxidoreductase [Alphaproteobacteria bacterium]
MTPTRAGAEDGGDDPNRGGAKMMGWSILSLLRPGEEVPACIARCRLAEELGYGAFWLSERGDGAGAVLLGALARETRRIRLGALLLRESGPAAPALAPLYRMADLLAGGRVDLAPVPGWRGDLAAVHRPPLPAPAALLISERGDPAPPPAEGPIPFRHAAGEGLAPLLVFDPPGRAPEAVLRAMLHFARGADKARAIGH